MSGTVARRVAFALTVVVQLVVLYVPTAPAPVPSDVRLDLVVHALVFGLVAWAGRRAGVRVLPLVVVLAGHAVLSELLQARLLPGRSADPLDVLADLVGTAVGAALPTGRVPKGRMAG